MHPALFLSASLTRTFAVLASSAAFVRFGAGFVVLLAASVMFLALFLVPGGRRARRWLATFALGALGLTLVWWDDPPAFLRASPPAAPVPSERAERGAPSTTPRPSSRLFSLQCNDRPGCVELGDNMLAGKPAASPERLRAIADGWRRQCDRGDMAGCESLGLAYLNGRGVRADQREAMTRFEFACEHGSMSSCDDLGAMYATRPEPDLSRALDLFAHACAGGDDSGCDDAKKLRN
jgi:hypothetical protein